MDFNFKFKFDIFSTKDSNYIYNLLLKNVIFY